MSRYRSLAILVLALMLSTGSAGLASLALRCARCGPHCPMSSKQHLGCHDRDKPRHTCDERGGARLTSCAHSGEIAPGLAWLAIPTPGVAVRPVVALREHLSPADSRGGRDVPEPPTEPPRLLVVVA
jgi:hypothetical protein